MWYAYEGENDLIALKAEDVKQIIDMNRQQQYPEKMEDYQVELMSTSALASESTDEEVEREIRRLAEGGNGVVGQDEQPAEPRRNQNHDDDRRHNNRDHGNRNDRQQNRGNKQEKHERNERPERNNKQERPQQRNNKPRRDGDTPRRSGGNNRDRRGD